MATVRRRFPAKANNLSAMHMHWTLIVTCVLAIWATAAGPQRLGSVALAVSWCYAQLWYCWSGEAVPILLYWLLDMFVIGAVLLWRESRLDWFILALFPVEWWVYDNLLGAERWWTLWALSGMQLIAAGPWQLLNHRKSDTSATGLQFAEIPDGRR